MSGSIFGAALLGTAALGTAVFTGAAITLFNRVIPRQEVLRVDMSEMADMETWEEYKKKIAPRSEWLNSQPLETVTRLKWLHTESRGREQGSCYLSSWLYQQSP